MTHWENLMDRRQAIQAGVVGSGALLLGRNATAEKYVRGTRVIEGVPFGRWATTTFVEALRATGFTVPLTVDGPINGRVLLAWVQQHLVPTLSPGDIVVMDNLSSHKVVGIREAIKTASAEVRYVPPYSPDLNPIELAFSGLKKLLRDGAERTVYVLWNLCGRILDDFSTDECRNFFKHSGYHD